MFLGCLTNFICYEIDAEAAGGGGVALDNGIGDAVGDAPLDNAPELTPTDPEKDASATGGDSTGDPPAQEELQVKLDDLTDEQLLRVAEQATPGSLLARVAQATTAKRDAESARDAALAEADQVKRLFRTGGDGASTTDTGGKTDLLAGLPVDEETGLYELYGSLVTREFAEEYLSMRADLNSLKQTVSGSREQAQQAAISTQIQAMSNDMETVSAQQVASAVKATIGDFKGLPADAESSLVASVAQDVERVIVSAIQAGHITLNTPKAERDTFIADITKRTIESNTAVKLALHGRQKAVNKEAGELAPLASGGSVAMTGQKSTLEMTEEEREAHNAELFERVTSGK
ncbi:MAG: hypothetical protein ABFD54_04485 [Armatimonadota bacterium]